MGISKSKKKIKKNKPKKKIINTTRKNDETLVHIISRMHVPVHSCFSLQW